MQPKSTKLGQTKKEEVKLIDVPKETPIPSKIKAPSNNFFVAKPTTRPITAWGGPGGANAAS